MYGCRCQRGDCSGCVCNQRRQLCTTSCTWSSSNTCKNAMANQALIDALTTLTSQMMMNQQAQQQAQQQLHADLAAQAAAIQQQQQAHQALLAQLANLPVAPPALGPRTAAVGLIPVYSGNAIDSLADWLSILNRTSVAEGWNDDVKRQVAIGKLSSSALEWHYLGKNQHAIWPLLAGSIGSHFLISVSLMEWCSQIERRVQLKKDLAGGGKLTEEQRTRLFDVIDRFSDCFVGNETASTRPGIEHFIDTGDALPIGTTVPVHLSDRPVTGPVRPSDHFFSRASLAIGPFSLIRPLHQVVQWVDRHCTLRCTSAYERRLISKQVQEMLVIERSNSPWAAQVVMVPKRDGSKRFCVDFRSINAKTKRDLYPLPWIDEIFKVEHASNSSGTTFMSSLDLKNGFWHVPIREQDREKTAFVTSDGLF